MLYAGIECGKGSNLPMGLHARTLPTGQQTFNLTALLRFGVEPSTRTFVLEPLYPLGYPEILKVKHLHITA